MAYVGFDRFVSKLKAEGKSDASAHRIAAWKGRKKYGKRVMAEAAAKGVPAYRVKK